MRADELPLHEKFEVVGDPKHHRFYRIAPEGNGLADEGHIAAHPVKERFTIVSFPVDKEVRLIPRRPRSERRIG